jgi:branched-chain amino acid transport system substrate-binding protein
MGSFARYVTATLVPAALTLALAAPVVAQAPVKVGVVLPLSGRNAVVGQSNLFGMRLVASTINSAGGIKSLGGAKIELVVADNASAAVSSAGEARRLIENERVVFILGPYSTPEAEATVPVTERAGVGMISTQASYDGLFDRNYKGFTTVSMTSSQFGKSYAEFVKWLAKSRGASIKTVAITYPDNDYGQTAAKSTQEELRAAGPGPHAGRAPAQADEPRRRRLHRLLPGRHPAPQRARGAELHRPADLGRRLRQLHR